jgi:lipopolysaccharide transport system ATP-binding protein
LKILTALLSRHPAGQTWTRWALLEVGTGFHPELTGRENIFMNGAILGMNRAEIRRKFDEIVAFAEVEKFLDTPVKRYSSGMYVRLAFAIAAHLDPEILLIDEVLVVGDTEFQKKCLGKMQDVSTYEGRTVIFVSHNLGAIAQLCSNTIWLDASVIRVAGDLERSRNISLQMRDEANCLCVLANRYVDGLAHPHETLRAG